MRAAEQPSGPLAVSVVIPVYDAAATLPACLRSLCAQTLPPDRYEVVVVDNNSRDGSAAVARLTPGVKLVEEPRQGAYAARNCGVRVARGSVIAFTDPDCVPAQDWLETALAALADGTVVAVGETLPAKRSWSLELLSTYARVKDEYVFSSTDAALYYGRTNNMAIRRSVFEALGPFVERPRGADTLLVRAAVERYGPESVRFEPQMRVSHAELDGVRSHLRKMQIYGYVNHLQPDAAPVRALRASEWAGFVREAARRTQGAASIPVLVGLTAATHSSWQLGSLRAAAGLGPPRGTAPPPSRRPT